MASTPPGPGFAPPAGQGVIQQRSRGRNIVRQRTIQHQLTDTLRYRGTAWDDPTSTSMAPNNRAYLATLARFWAHQLTGADRAAWSAAAPPGLNGFGTFMSVNKVTQMVKWRQPFLSAWDGLPVFPLATGMQHFAVTDIHAITLPAGTSNPWERLQLNSVSDGTWDALTISFVVKNGNLSSLPGGNRYLLDTIPPVIFPGVSIAGLVAWTVFGNIPSGIPMTAYIRAFNSASGIIGRSSLRVTFPPG